MRFGRKSAGRREDDADRHEPTAEEWLSEFRPVRPDNLTAADRDAAAADWPRPQRPAQPDPRHSGRGFDGRDRGYRDGDRAAEDSPFQGGGFQGGDRGFRGRDGGRPDRGPAADAGPRADRRPRPDPAPRSQPRGGFRPEPESYPDRAGRPEQQFYPERQPPRGPQPYPGPGGPPDRGPRPHPGPQYSAGQPRPDQMPGQRRPQPRQSGPENAPRGYPGGEYPPARYNNPGPGPDGGRDRGRPAGYHGPRPETPPRERSDRHARPGPDSRPPELPPGPPVWPDVDARSAREAGRGQFRDYRRDRDYRLAERDAQAADDRRRPAAEAGGLVGRPPARDSGSYRTIPESSSPPSATNSGATAGVAGTNGVDVAALARVLAALQQATQTELPPVAATATGLADPLPVPTGPADPGQAGLVVTAERDEDSEPTSPLPVILPGATELPRPAPVHQPRGFFEAARPVADAPEVAATTVPANTLPANTRPAEPPVPDKPLRRERVMPEAASAKLEQLKDLYLTAEAIGEEALDKHFDQVSQRQRELIREFFERSGPGSEVGSDNAGG